MYASELKALILALRWRRDDMRKFGEIYFYVSGGSIEKTKDYGNEKDDKNYKLGNYFLDSTEAKEVLESKEYKDFWEKVRGNEIGIDLNKLMDYKSLAYGASNMAQLGKVKEEYKELLAEVRETSTFIEIKNRDNFVAEGLDLITATVNLMLLSGLTEQDFEKHIAKLESYKVGKYKR